MNAATLLPSIERVSRQIASGKRQGPLKYLADGERFFDGTACSSDGPSDLIAQVQTFFVFIAVELEHAQKAYVVYLQSIDLEETAKYRRAIGSHHRKAAHYARQVVAIVKRQAMTDADEDGPLPSIERTGGDLSA